MTVGIAREAPKAGLLDSLRSSNAPIRPRKLGRAREAIFLVPGLLGFETFSTFSYFADRVAAALRSALEVKLGRTVYVIPVPIPPTASLAARQAELVKTIAGRLQSLQNDLGRLEVHLVGHSTGGVDANLLTNEQPLALATPSGTEVPRTWLSLDARAAELRKQIRSVISIASPHQGACIANDSVARVFAAHDFRGLPALVSLVAKFAACSLHDVEVEEAADGVLRAGAVSLGFARDIARRWALLGDLNVDAPRRDTALAPSVTRRSIVTIAGQPRIGEGATSSDAFFRALSERAAGWTSGTAERGKRVKASVERLIELTKSDAASDFIIKSPLTDIPALDAGCNDGVVNSARQLIDPSDPDELVAMVAADHFDVVGYYDRYRWRSKPGEDERMVRLRGGFMHSGSVFGDDEFFALWDRVAEVIANLAS